MLKTEETEEMSPGVPHLIQIEDFTIDLTRSCFLRKDEIVFLRRQSFDVLRYLVERPGKVITKKELVVTVWASLPADPDGSIVQCIKKYGER